LSKRQHRLVSNVIKYWQQTEKISQETAVKLSESIIAVPFDWKRLARYSFIIAICCFVIAIGSVLADEALLKLLEHLFNSPPIVKSVFFAIIAAAIFRYGLIRRNRFPHKTYSNEAIFFIGVLAIAATVGFLGVALDTGTKHYSILFLMASILYVLLGLWFPSKQVWVFGLLSLGAWMGTETGYVSGGGMYFLGMNYPLRFVIFGAALTVLGLWGYRTIEKETDTIQPPEGILQRVIYLSPQTKVIGLLNFFIALWIMSIFGNYGDMETWHKTPQYELLHWSLLFGVAALAAAWYGLKEDDSVCRGFGLTFLFINLYTRFFEYFWDTMHKAFIFAILAASFWYLGTKAEKIWHFGENRKILDAHE
jgi:energy-converting hydrogenase Eha subunit A